MHNIVTSLTVVYFGSAVLSIHLEHVFGRKILSFIVLDSKGKEIGND